MTLVPHRSELKCRRAEDLETPAFEYRALPFLYADSQIKTGCG
jgi:hypothetical protein